jgi:hypothetical protein
MHQPTRLHFYAKKKNCRAAQANKGAQGQLVEHLE